jgi:hypothetical protein
VVSTYWILLLFFDLYFFPTRLFWIFFSIFFSTEIFSTFFGTEKSSCFWRQSEKRSKFLNGRGGRLARDTRLRLLESIENHPFRAKMPGEALPASFGCFSTNFENGGFKLLRAFDARVDFLDPPMVLRKKVDFAGRFG